MTEARDSVKVIIVAGLIITAVTWTVDVIADVFIDSQGDLMTSLFRPGLNESAERLAVVMIVFGIIGYFMELVKSRRDMIRDQDDLKETVYRLKHGGETLKRLKSLLPTCSSCYGMRDDFGTWYELDVYLKTYPEAIYAEGFCPGCTKEISRESEAEALSKEDLIPQA